MKKLQEQRHRDFIAACVRARRDLMAGGVKATDRQVAREALRGGAPGYYVEFEYALGVLYTYYNTGMLPASQQGRQALWRELIAKVNRRRRLGESTRSALQRTLSGESASQFFIAESTAIREYRLHRRRSLNT